MLNYVKFILLKHIALITTDINNVKFANIMVMSAMFAL